MSQSTITSNDLKLAAKVTSTKRKVREYGDLITCSICKGYIIDATAVKHCLHTCKLIFILLQTFKVLENGKLEWI